MAPSPRLRFSPATIVAVLALVLALGGTAYAAAKLTGADIVNNSLTGADVAEPTLATVPSAASAPVAGWARVFDAAKLPAGVERASALAVCPPGTNLLGGGADASEILDITINAPDSDSTWQVTVKRKAGIRIGVEGQFSAHALCGRVAA